MLHAVLVFVQLIEPWSEIPHVPYVSWFTTPNYLAIFFWADRLHCSAWEVDCPSATALSDRPPLMSWQLELHVCCSLFKVCMMELDRGRLMDEKSSVALCELRNGVKKQELDTDIQREYNRQRDYLEKSVDNLKRKFLGHLQIRWATKSYQILFSRHRRATN